MGWDRKGSHGPYYYRVVRRPDRPWPIKVYVGKGAEAEAAAQADEARRLERRTARQAAQAAAAEAARLLTRASTGLACLEMLVGTALVLTGYHRHRGEWRRRRGCTQSEVGTRRVDLGRSGRPAGLDSRT